MPRSRSLLSLRNCGSSPAMYRFERALLKQTTLTGFSETREVRFQDVDAAGIIFYPRVFEFFHDLYVAFLADAGFPLHEVLRDKTFAAPIRHAEADYFRPLRFGDQVAVGLVAAHLEPDEVTLGFQLRQHDQVCVVGQTLHTFVDTARFQRMAIPEPLAQAFGRLRVE